MKSTFYWYNTQKNYQTIGTWFNLHIFLPIWLLMHAIPYERVFQHTWGILHNKTHNSFVLEKEKTTSVTINGYLFLFQAGFIVQLCNNSPLRSKSQRLRQVEAEEVLELELHLAFRGMWLGVRHKTLLLWSHFFIFCIFASWSPEWEVGSHYLAQPLSEKDELSTAQLSIECQHSP